MYKVVKKTQSWLTKNMFAENTLKTAAEIQKLIFFELRPTPFGFRRLHSKDVVSIKAVRAVVTTARFPSKGANTIPTHCTDVVQKSLIRTYILRLLGRTLYGWHGLYATEFRRYVRVRLVVNSIFPRTDQVGPATYKGNSNLNYNRANNDNNSNN